MILTAICEKIFQLEEWVRHLFELFIWKIRILGKKNNSKCISHMRSYCNFSQKSIPPVHLVHVHHQTSIKWWLKETSPKMTHAATSWSTNLINLDSQIFMLRLLNQRIWRWKKSWFHSHIQLIWPYKALTSRCLCFLDTND